MVISFYSTENGFSENVVDVFFSIVKLHSNYALKNTEKIKKNGQKLIFNSK